MYDMYVTLGGNELAFEGVLKNFLSLYKINFNGC